MRSGWRPLRSMGWLVLPVVLDGGPAENRDGLTVVDSAGIEIVTTTTPGP